MHRKKIAAVTMAAIITNFSATTIEVLASEIPNSNTSKLEISSENEVKKATISKFDLYNNDKLNAYNEVFKMDNSNITSITNNGGKYGSDNIEKSIDGNLKTHWETGKPNSSEFTNEVVVGLNEVTNLNRIVYAARQASAKGKGFAQEVEIYTSLTNEGDDFRLVTSGEYKGSSGDIVEIKFNSTEFKRIKFKFKKANQDWASASEFMFYKEDEISDKMKSLFINSSKNQVSEEFNSIEKIIALESEVKNHPLYGDFKEDIDNAKLIVDKKEVSYTDAKVSKFKDINSDLLPAYNEIYKLPSNKIVSIIANGGSYAENAISRAIDGNPQTKWHSAKQNSSSFTNEVVMELSELTKLNRIVYTAPRGSNRGFAEAFDIYASTTSKGDTFDLVSSGTSQITQNSIEIRFNPTEFKRVKFVFKKGYENWACAAEFGLYTQDELSEKMDRLFKDSAMSQIGDEFNTVEKIKVLEEEAKSHPFYEDYKENLLNAIELVQQGEVTSTNAIISKFTPFYTSHINEYDKAFRIGSEKIANISNNGGQYGGSALKFAVDEDVNTHWETGRPNSDSFKNEVNLTLEEDQVLNRLVYKSRNGGKGFAKNFSIYVSPTTKGDNFSKITTGEYTVTSDLLEVQFNPTKVKRLKFVFDNVQDSWASIGDLRLYKEDKVYDKMKSLFTNGLMNEVAENFNTLEKLSALENEVKGHPLEELFKVDINTAKDIVQGKLETTKVVVAEQHGDMVQHADKNLKFGFGNNNQPTGVLAKPGEKLTVYVDADPKGPLPQIFFSQQEGSWSTWGRTLSLHPGKNIITVPEIPKDKEYHHDVTKGGPIYIVNPYTPEQQPKAPVIRFVGGQKFPFVTKDTNIEEFKKFLIEYKKKIDEDKKKNPNVLDREVIDTFEFVSDHIFWTGTATGAYQAYIEQGVNPLDTIKSYNTHMKELFKYYALDGSSIKNDPKYIRDNVRLAQPFGYMYAASGHIGVQGDVMASLLVPFEDRGGSWGLTHEIGHRMDVGARVFGEVTNNMLPMYMSGYYNKLDKRIPYDSHVYKNVLSESSNKYTEGGFFENLAVYWQLEMYKPGYWGQLNRLYRERNVSLGEENPTNLKMQYLIKFSSEVIGEDLSGYFARHGFEVNEETRQETSKYPKPSKKIWYLNDNKFDYKGKGFVDKNVLEVSLNQVENKTKITFNVKDNAKSDLLGFEVIKDGEIIGFTSNNSFIDTSADHSKNSKYEVVPYDLNLGTGDKVAINSFSPSIKVQQDKLILRLNEEFNPMDYVKGNSNNGQDLTSKVKFESNVNTAKKGLYKVIYTLEDAGITTEKVVSVEVVSNYDYLSDDQWKSVETKYGTPRRNTNIKGRVNGDIKTFEKGFGIHANGKIVYDLSGKDYDKFEALLGVDMGLQAQDKSSITFKIVGDGKTLATTPVLKHADNMININVDVKGVKELVIEIHDGGNGNSSDHGIIANPKLTTNNSKPVITAKDKVYKLGDKVDIMGGVIAKDAEDGNLTSKIEIISNNYKEGQAGRFEVVYKVTDSDKNSVEKKSYITVYEELSVNKSKFGQFDNLAKYNKEFKLPVKSVSNNGGNYGSSVIAKAIDNNINTHWETGKVNSSSFNNEVIFDLGQNSDIDKMAYSARRDAGGKGFARKFEIYVSDEAQGDDFVLSGKGEYTGSNTDVVEFKISKNNVRRVKFKFIEANQGWASLSEVSFYKKDTLSDKVSNDLFTDNSKTEITEKYNTLEKVAALREEVKNHPAFKLFESDLNKAEEIIKAKFPTLKVEENTFVKLNSEFDLMSDVVANDQEDGNIANKVEVNSNGFTTSKTGEYTITYKVTDSDKNIITKERKVVVYSEDKYISDISWKSAVSGWKNVNKDFAVNTSNKIKLNVNGEIKEFNKGIGAATNAEIVYNLDGNYTHFTTYLGTDKNYNDNRTSIIFKIFADGKEVYISDTIRRDSKAEFVNIPVAGVKELKLVANDAGDGGLGDFASWADTKLYTTNSKPKLIIPKSVATKLGEKIDLNENYVALDAEDGDITSKVEVTGKVNFNKPGKYPITYKVTDSDGNEISKTRTIAVVNMQDYKYLSDYDWKSTQNSYKTPNKDKSMSDKALRLTDENGAEVVYEKGIGAHATSTITYDLTDKDYAYFSSYVGVDRQMFGTVASVSFEVYVDGTKKFDSGVMNSRDSQKYVEVGINGAKELKLVVTDGKNGIGSDHASWGGAKLHFANPNGEGIESEEIKELRKMLEHAQTITKDMMGATTHIEARWSNFEAGKKLAKDCIEDGNKSEEEIKSVMWQLNYFIEELQIK
ncbi:NPCBM/NEW2 domain-containing protein [Clostridium sp. CCUG 7971]|uniref:NPCBM/NEW2 domain-containing protein n=1 Tax=Clostridium sp. CCUG 7971 TaxID=2811414 RepID=UPI001ABAEAA8|nr:NPCBM/NEW2 domain-containing protein [Clostridium sp. CCUG 7971]MBO3444968.1 NPCBM/NEW2 domain-containing protein [Clostridium sp. CCUG 7971]